MVSLLFILLLLLAATRLPVTVLIVLLLGVGSGFFFGFQTQVVPDGPAPSHPAVNESVTSQTTLKSIIGSK